MSSTLGSQTLNAMDMITYWKKERANHQAPNVLAVIDAEILKYQEQVEHLRDLRVSAILTG